MAAGEPDFDTPKAIKDACIQALNDSKVYYTPASGLPELRKLVAKSSPKKTTSPVLLNSAWLLPAPSFRFSALLRLSAAPVMK